MSTSTLASGLAGAALVPLAPVAEGALVAGSTWVAAKGLAAAGALTVAVIGAGQAAGFDVALINKAREAYAAISADPADSAAWKILVDIGQKAGGVAERISNAIVSGTSVIQVPKGAKFDATIAEYVEGLARLLNVSHDRSLLILIHLYSGTAVGLTSQSLTQYAEARAGYTAY